MQISLVIPTFNRSALLPDTIPALMNQQTSEEISYEAIFVSNGSSDETDVILREAEQRYLDKLRYIYIEPTGGPAAPRNVGICAARGDAIVILDDDVLPDPGLVQAYADYHRDHPEPQAAAVGEAYVPHELLDDPLSLFHAYSYDKIKHGDVASYIFFWTCNVSVKRDFVIQAGLFDERFLWNEDIVLGYHLDRNGMQLRFCPGASGAHLHHLDKEKLPARGTATGRWIWATAELFPDRELLDRYGVLSRRLGPYRFMKRLVNRGAFRLLDNPLINIVLRRLGAEGQKRNRITDLYYYLLYRRHIVAGFNQAKRAARSKIRKGETVEPTALVRALS